MAGSVRLGRLLGIPFAIHYTWLLAAGLATIILSVSIFPLVLPGLAPPAYWLIGVVGSSLFFCSVVLHELCHALVARHLGIPVRGITLFIFGGVATITREARKPSHEMFIAIAGPACSLCLFILLFVAQRLLLPHWLLGSRLCLYLSLANLALTLFNLLPALPLDGGRALRAIIWSLAGDFRTATRIAAALGHLLGFALIGFGLYTLAVQSNWIQGSLLIVLALFVHSAADMSRQDAQDRDLLEGLTLASMPKTEVAFVAPETLLQTLVYDYLLAEDQSPTVLVVMRNNELAGTITAREIRPVARVHWTHTQAQDVMKECTSKEFMQPTTPLEDALEHLEEQQLGHVVVMNGAENPIDVVSYNDIVHFLHRRRESHRKGVGIEEG
jgi:Zn-dependent protease/CBS domain-containing protein